MSVENLVQIVFLRGMTMQSAVPRDALNRSSYGMVAADPKRGGSRCSPKVLFEMVDLIQELTGELLQVSAAN